MLKEHGIPHVVDLSNQSPGFLDPTHFRGEGTRPLKKPGEGIWRMLHLAEPLQVFAHKYRLTGIITVSQLL
jgi:hypothetical protein